MANYLWVPTVSERSVTALTNEGIYVWNRYGTQPAYAGNQYNDKFIKLARYAGTAQYPGDAVVAVTNVSGVTLWTTLGDNLANYNLSQTSNGLYYIGIGSANSSVPGSFVSDVVASLPKYSTILEAVEACNDGNWTGSTTYPITYSYTNSTVSGPSEAAVGDTVTVSAIPDNNYGITDPASQILVTNNDVAVSYNWNPSTNAITFVMPDPT